MCADFRGDFRSGRNLARKRRELGITRALRPHAGPDIVRARTRAVQLEPERTSGAHRFNLQYRGTGKEDGFANPQRELLFVPWQMSLRIMPIFCVTDSHLHEEPVLLPIRNAVIYPDALIFAMSGVS